jgi:hypothetical protein
MKLDLDVRLKFWFFELVQLMIENQIRDFFRDLTKKIFVEELNL